MSGSSLTREYQRYNTLHSSKNVLAETKQSSLFCHAVNDVEEKFYNIDTWVNVLKLFIVVIYKLEK